MGQILWVIVALPLAGAFINGVIGPKMSRGGVNIFALGSTGLSFIFALDAFADLLALSPEHRVINNTVYSWISAGDLNVDVGFMLDPLSGLWLLVVTGVPSMLKISTLCRDREEAWKR